MRKYFLTLDLEEWQHLEYLKKYGHISSKQSYINSISEFFDLLDEYGIKITVFVVGNTANEHKGIIRDIQQRGHTIASHSYSHPIVYKMSDSEFIEDAKKSKSILEDITGAVVEGFRAPCFSMDNRKIDLLFGECGYKYDSSLIRFKDHPLYGEMDMSSFTKLEDLIYEREGCYVFEVPTLDILGKSLPISGGGYFRLFPLFLNQFFYKKSLQVCDNFVFYIHPFELNDASLDIYDQLSKKDKFRFQVGRKDNLKKLRAYFDYIISKEVKFDVFSEYIKSKED